MARGAAFAWRLLEVERAMRWRAQDNAEALDELFCYANSLVLIDHSVRIDGKVETRDVSVRLSKRRVLYIMLWTEMAIHGPTPHARWSADYRKVGSRASVSLAPAGKWARWSLEGCLSAPAEIGLENETGSVRSFRHACWVTLAVTRGRRYTWNLARSSRSTSAPQIG
jgi:hypothetical protein